MAFDAFLKIGDIKGESTDDKHKEWIDILSYSQGLTQQPGTDGSRAGGHTGGRVDVQDMSFVKMVDQSTPKLVEACATGKHIPEATVELCSASGEKHTYMMYKMKDVLVSSVQNAGSAGGELRPTESLSIRFSEITWEYTPFDNKGKAGTPVRTGWSLETNKLVS